MSDLQTVKQLDYQTVLLAYFQILLLSDCQTARLANWCEINLKFSGTSFQEKGATVTLK